MADAANKYPENVPGKFYVDDQCIDCDLCRETAPANFKRNDDGGHSYVYKQPETPDEEGLCNACRLNDVIPDLAVEGNRERWAKLELAKRRLLLQLDELHLKYSPEDVGPGPAPAASAHRRIGVRGCT